ncbi:MAG: hypothetical protein COA69_13825 [Robiginitomaculum sp.]|nr:MAG: hypothetical protein COA69_13825 [Robiginitomaculum sp.]
MSENTPDTAMDLSEIATDDMVIDDAGTEAISAGGEEPSMEDILASIRQIIADDKTEDLVDLASLENTPVTGPTTGPVTDVETVSNGKAHGVDVAVSAPNREIEMVVEPPQPESTAVIAEDDVDILDLIHFVDESIEDSLTAPVASGIPASGSVPASGVETPTLEAVAPVGGNEDSQIVADEQTLEAGAGSKVSSLEVVSEDATPETPQITSPQVTSPQITSPQAISENTDGPDLAASIDFEETLDLVMEADVPGSASERPVSSEAAETPRSREALASETLTSETLTNDALASETPAGEMFASEAFENLVDLVRADIKPDTETSVAAPVGVDQVGALADVDDGLEIPSMSRGRTVARTQPESPVVEATVEEATICVTPDEDMDLVKSLLEDLMDEDVPVQDQDLVVDSALQESIEAAVQEEIATAQPTDEKAPEETQPVFVAESSTPEEDVLEEAVAEEAVAEEQEPEEDNLRDIAAEIQQLINGNSESVDSESEDPEPDNIETDHLEADALESGNSSEEDVVVLPDVEMGDQFSLTAKTDSEPVGMGAVGSGTGAASALLVREESVETPTQDREAFETDDTDVDVSAEQQGEPVDAGLPQQPTQSEEDGNMAQAVTTESMLDESTQREAIDAFASLASAVQEKSDLEEKGPAIGDLVQDSLRPMLKEWLDKNLKGIVERAVTKEIKRMSSGK